MGKQGPCYHCGITNTPLWRNGPPEKPVLCNACGSRWRTKGTLANYTPLHAREHIDIKELRVPKVKPNEQKLHKRKQTNCNIEVEQEHEIASSDQNFHKVFEEDTSNRSSSGSAISYSESCSHFGGMDASDLTVQCNVWDSLVPSRKRTCVNRPKPSPVEKLTRDLHSILHQQSSTFSASLEDDLLYETKTPMGSVEIGNGGVLIRLPNTAVLEEESEASSLPIDNKSSTANEAYSGYSSLHIVSKEPSCAILSDEKLKRTLAAQEHVKREKASYEKLNILRSRDSPLSYVDLTEVINFEGFMRYLTHDERQQLMKYLPSMDCARSPESLKSMFHSSQFSENISYFKQLLVEGIFDISCSGMNEDERRALKKLVLVNLAKSKWVEHYTKLKDAKNSEVVCRKGVRTGANFVGSSNSLPLRRPNERQSQNLTEKKAMIKSPKRPCKLGITNLCTPLKSPQLNSSNPGTRSTIETNEYMENDVSIFGSRSFFASPDRNSMLNSLYFNDENLDEDLLLDVRSNASFPEAELLSESWKQNALNSQSAESGVDSLSFNPTSCSSSQQPKQWND